MLQKIEIEIERHVIYPKDEYYAIQGVYQSRMRRMICLLRGRSSSFDTSIDPSNIIVVL